MEVIDQNVLRFFVENRTEWLSFLMLIITYAGSYLIVSTVTLLSAISFYIHKYTVKIIPLIVSVFGSAISVFVIKHIFYRARPIAEALYLETGSAFPSGHATAAMALYGFILYTIWKHERHPLRNPFIIFLTILIILVGMSRLYLGVHYLSDVVTGYIIGIFWLTLAVRVVKSKF